MTLEDKSLTSLNHEFKEYENINIECEIGVLDFWNINMKKESQICGFYLVT